MQPRNFTYAVEWSPERIDAYVDANLYFSTFNEGKGFEVWPFDHDFHVILNLAIGGVWGSKQGVDDASFPQRPEIDYVRVYQEK